jgi:hypothetical protein
MQPLKYWAIEMKKYLSAILILLIAGWAFGQILETPVPFDSAGKIIEWDRKLESKAMLFPDVKGFYGALLWKTDSLYALEIMSERGRLKRSLTPLGLDSLRVFVDAHLLGQGRRYGLNQEGRGAYLLWQIPLSLGWYGPAVLTLTKPDNASTGTGIYMTSAAVTYFFPFLLTKNRQITSGQEHLSVACGFRGIAVGSMLCSIMRVKDEQVYSATMLATSITGQIAGYHFGSRFTKPQARMISNYATLGMAYLPLFSALIKDHYEDEESFFRTQSYYMLSGLAGGGSLGYRLAHDKYCSDGQPTIIAAAGWAGLLAGAGAYFVIKGPYETGVYGGHHFEISSGEVKLATLMALSTSASGLYLAHKYTKGYTFSRGDGFIVMGSTAAGGLLGCGLGFLIHSSGDLENNGFFQTVSGLSSLGLITGYALGIYSVRNQEHEYSGNLGLSIDGAPLGLAFVLSKTQARIPWITGSF